MILVPALRLTLAGLAVGLLAAVVMSRYTESQFFGVQPLDLTSFATVIVLVPLAGLLAGYLPARRAAATDPARVLRQD